MFVYRHLLYTLTTDHSLHIEETRLSSLLDSGKFVLNFSAKLRNSGPTKNHQWFSTVWCVASWPFSRNSEVDLEKKGSSYYLLLVKKMGDFFVRNVIDPGMPCFLWKGNCLLILFVAGGNFARCQSLKKGGDWKIFDDRLWVQNSNVKKMDDVHYRVLHIVGDRNARNWSISLLEAHTRVVVCVAWNMVRSVWIFCKAYFHVMTPVAWLIHATLDMATCNVRYSFQIQNLEKYKRQF